MEDDCITTTDVSLKDKEGVVSSLSILPSYNEDIYRSRVCYSQYIEDKDVYAIGIGVSKFKFLGTMDKVDDIDKSNALLIILDELSTFLTI